MRAYLFVLLVVAGCKGKTEDKPSPLVQHDDLGAIDQKVAPEPLPAEVVEPPAPPPPRAIPEEWKQVHERVALWPNAPAGSHMVGDWSVNSLGVGPGFVYACADGQVRAAPKSGGPVVERGECGHAFDFETDGSSIFWCDDRGPRSMSPQSGPTSLADIADSCIAAAVDDTHFYYIVPSFEGVPDSGLYRIAKDGGTPQLVKATRKGEQLIVALDGDSIWIGNVFAGTISRMKKSGGGASVVISGQKGIVELLVSGDDLYWYSENNEEIRKRARRGGAITTLARGITSEPIAIHDGTLYWTTWDTREQGSTSTMYKLRPGASEPEVIVRELRGPDFRVDADGIYVAQMDVPGVLAIPHTER